MTHFIFYINFYYLGHLTAGQETTTNTYVGHNFYFTLSENKSHEIARFDMVADQVLYIVRDSEYPASDELLISAENEMAFTKEYLNKTGNYR